MREHVTLSELLGDVKNTLDKAYSRYTYRVLAEITDIKVYYNRQYAFLNLIEKQNGDIVATVGAVIWRDNFHIIREFEKATGVTFNQNLELVLEVEIQFHVRYGLRISVVAIDETYTLGKLEQEKQNVLLSLVKDHPKLVWMLAGETRSANHLRKLPMVMQKIALIAAPGSDGRRDFLHELENNAWNIDYSLMEFPAQVQGEAAAGQIAAQLHKINSTQNSFHGIAIVRGGGGNTDFSAFDSYQVGLAVAQCPYPVFTGIGHERNVSITDLLAFGPEKTPTKCAAAFTEHNLNFLSYVQNARENIGKRCLGKIQLYQQQTRNMGANILKSAQWRITRERQTLHQFEEKLKMAGPQGTLQRGFALVRKDGKHIAKAEKLAPGDRIEIEFTDGKRQAIIE